MIQHYFKEIISAKLNAWHADNQTTFDYQPSYEKNSIEYFIEKICYHNYQGWHYEDLGQQEDVNKIIRGWRGSQVNNRNRNQTIHCLDSYFSSFYCENAPFHTESLGVILDKISILYLKYLHLLEKEEAQSKKLLETIYLLVSCAQLLYDDIMAGRKRCITFPHKKLYDEHAS